jgi:hypothetical protein
MWRWRAGVEAEGRRPGGGGLSGREGGSESSGARGFSLHRVAQRRGCGRFPGQYASDRRPSFVNVVVVVLRDLLHHLHHLHHLQHLLLLLLVLFLQRLLPGSPRRLIRPYEDRESPPSPERAIFRIFHRLGRPGPPRRRRTSISPFRTLPTAESRLALAHTRTCIREHIMLRV